MSAISPLYKKTVANQTFFKPEDVKNFDICLPM